MELEAGTRVIFDDSTGVVFVCLGFADGNYYFQDENGLTSDIIVKTSDEIAELIANMRAPQPFEATDTSTTSEATNEPEANSTDTIPTTEGTEDADVGDVDENEEQDVENDGVYWSLANTKLLIAEYREVKAAFAGKGKKKGDLWKEVSKRVIRITKNELLSKETCDRKWRNLLNSYRRINRKKGKSGAAGGRKWPFYDLMDEVEGKTASCRGIKKSTRPTVNAAPAISNSQTATEDSTPSPSTSTSTESAAVRVSVSGNRRPSTGPKWFDKFLQEERQRQDEWRGEVRAHFTRIENLQGQRLSLMQEAVSMLKNDKVNE